MVIERNVSDGMRAMPGDVLFRIVDHRAIWVLADVTERDLAGIRPWRASPRPCGSVASPAARSPGPVTRIYPHLSMETRTARVRIELANPDGILRPAMYADVEFATGSAGTRRGGAGQRRD